MGLDSSSNLPEGAHIVWKRACTHAQARTHTHTHPLKIMSWRFIENSIDLRTNDYGKLTSQLA